jgi:hypothetical protein
MQITDEIRISVVHGLDIALRYFRRIKRGRLLKMISGKVTQIVEQAHYLNEFKVG